MSDDIAYPDEFDFGDLIRPMFDKCMVCGCPIHKRDEQDMGLCSRCAWDWQPDAREREGM